MNDEELRSTEELLKEREREALIELGKRKPEDEKRSKILAEAKTLSEIRLAYDGAERARTQEQAKNDLEDRKLEIEREKIQTERKKARWDAAKAFLYLFGGLTTGLGSYMLDPWFQKDQRFQRFGERLHDMIMRR